MFVLDLILYLAVFAMFVVSIWAIAVTAKGTFDAFQRYWPLKK